MKRTALILIAISILSVLYSFTISAYTDRDEYFEKYLALDWQKMGSRSAYDNFYRLREEYLTSKYRIQDYGFTFLILGISTLILFRKGMKVNAPSSRLKIALVGFGAAVLTTAGYVGDLFLEFFRGSYPWWADSIGIPLMGAPVMAIVLVGWTALNLFALNGKFKAGSPITFRQLSGSNYFYLALFIVTSLIVVLCAADGFFWLVLPGILWLYFYASLWSGRSETNELNQQDEQC